MSQTDIDHSYMVTSLAKPGSQIRAELTDNDYSLIFEAGLYCNEAGNLLDSVKKQVIYNKKSDMKSDLNIQRPAGLSDEQCHLLHMVMGIIGEASELSIAIFQHVDTNQRLDIVNVIEEMGDIEFYLEGLRQAIAIDREQILKSNITKLGERYEGHEYSDKQAIDRADKTPVNP